MFSKNFLNVKASGRKASPGQEDKIPDGGAANTPAGPANAPEEQASESEQPDPTPERSAD